MKARYVILTIDTISDIFKDYLSEEDLPTNAQPVKMYVNPSSPGRFAIEFECLDWASGLPPLNVNFHIKRVFASV